MDTKLTRDDWTRLSVAILGLSGLLITGWFAVGVLAVGIVLVLATSLLLLVQLQYHRQQEATLQGAVEKSKQHQEILFQQTEALQ